MRKGKWYTLISIFVAMVFLLNTAAVAPVSALPNANTVYSNIGEVTAGSTAEIPILISQNSGIAGFGIYITYDPDVFTPVSVTDTGGIIQGKTQNSIGGNLQNIPENTIKIMCSGGSNFTADGLLFTIIFAVDPSANGNTVLHLSYDKDDTIDESINEVVLSCSDVSLTIINSGLSSLPQIELAAENAPAVHSVSVRGILKVPKELSSARIALQYDSSAFTYVSAKSAAAITDITNTADQLSFSLSGINAVGKGEELFEVVLAYSDGISAGHYQFTGSASSVIGASGIYFINDEIELTNGPIATAVISSARGLTNNQGHIVSVPIVIQDNLGLMGYKLSFTYNGADITPMRVVNDLLFPTGSFGDNIGLKQNAFDVLWNGIDPSDENGQIFHIEFQVSTDAVKDAVITVSYSASDTYDGDYQDVLLLCSDIVIALNSYTEIRDEYEATCCETGYSGDTYCRECGEKLAAGAEIPATGNHIDTDGKWESDETQHWHTCYYGTRFDIVSHSGGTATCTGKAVCAVCAAEYGAFADHKLTHHDRVEPSIEQDGNIEYWTCDECGKYFSDADGKNEISAQDTLIPMLSIKEYQFLGGEIIIEAPTDVIPYDCTFDVRKIVPPPEHVVEDVHEQCGSAATVCAYYEIRLTDAANNPVIYLDGKITIKIRMPEEYVGNSGMRVLQKDAAGTLIDMATWLEGEYLCYKTDWLEAYL